MLVHHKFGYKMQTLLCEAKPRLASLNHDGRYLFYWDITQHRVVFPYQHFGTNCQSQLLDSGNPKDKENGRN
jgi:hypothetical protein